MRLRDDYQMIDEWADRALTSIRQGAEVNLDAVFSAGPVAPTTLRARAHRGWLMIPGAIAAALLAMVIPEPGFQSESRRPPAIAGSELYSPAPVSQWNGSDLVRPVSDVPRIRSRTGRDVIGVVGDDGNLYWIEVERTRTVRWPATGATRFDANDSM